MSPTSMLTSTAEHYYFCLHTHRVTQRITYYSSISAPNVHQGAWPGSQHPEDILHLGCGRRDKREADFPQGGCDERSSHRVQCDQRPSQQPRDDDT